MLMVIVDPFFHFHGPLKHIKYKMDNEASQNQGILEHFSYDALITGSSMIENFVPSRFDIEFGVNSVIASLFACSPKKLGGRIKEAFKYNDQIKMIFTSFNIGYIDEDKDRIRDGLLIYL